MKMEKSFLLFVLGATNVGKSTFLEKVKQAYSTDVHLIEVGKMLRAKYPPGHFQGQGAPAHTQNEAIDLLCHGINMGEQLGSKYIIVDGQPRNVGQAESIMGWAPWPRSPHRIRAVVELVCPRAERERRALARDVDPDRKKLALDRLDRDVLDLHEVLISFTRYEIHRFNTGRETYSPVGAFQRVLREYGAIQEPGPEFMDTFPLPKRAVL